MGTMDAASVDGTMMTLPNWRKSASNVNALVIPRCSRTTLLVQSVKLQRLSVYRRKVSQAAATSAGVR